VTSGGSSFSARLSAVGQFGIVLVGHGEMRPVRPWPGMYFSSSGQRLLRDALVTRVDVDLPVAHRQRGERERVCCAMSNRKVEVAQRGGGMPSAWSVANSLWCSPVRLP